MTDSLPENLDRRSMSFAQAEGVEPLPSQLALRQISQPLAVALWNIIHLSMDNNKRTGGAYTSVGYAWEKILRDYHVQILERFSDEFSAKLVHWQAALKPYFADRDYIKAFTFIQFVIRHPSRPDHIRSAVATALHVNRAAYFLDGDTIFPRASEEEGRALMNALTALRNNEFGGSRSHLTAAAGLLSAGDYPGSVRESISAVESIARALEPEGSKLSAVLAKLEGGGRLHKGLKAAFASLYGYTSDAKGIRHALVFEDKADVDEADAIFMIGACASFVSFVISKGSLKPGQLGSPVNL